MTFTPRNFKISWTTANPYNTRWQFKWKHSFYTYPKDPNGATQVKKPQDTWEVLPMYWTWVQDIIYRWIPSAKMWYDRRTRLFDRFNLYLLPGTSLLMHQFSDVCFGFNYLTYLPLILIYIRVRDKTLDPDFKETYLRDMIYQNQEVS
jgi:hypothetical protein